MKRYTVDCPDCQRTYNLDFTGPVKFCSFCKSDKVKVKHRPAPPTFLNAIVQGLTFGAAFGFVNRYLDVFEGKCAVIPRALESPKPRRKQDAKP